MLVTGIVTAFVQIYKILIDYIKILIRNIAENTWTNNPYLDFYDVINLDTGEIRTLNKYGKNITTHKTAYYKGLDFKLYSTGTLTISGSLHKFNNDGAHNFNDFNKTALINVVNELQNKFNLDLQKCIIRGVEVGVNFTPPIETNTIIDNVFLHNTTPFEKKYYSNEGKFVQCEHSHYIVKIYNKALHYLKYFPELKTQRIMRFELKYKKMERLNKIGIYTLNDIINTDFAIFKNELTTEWKKILYYDTTIEHNSIKLKDYNNSNYWNELLKTKSKSTFDKHKNKLKKITENYSQKIQFSINEIITNKINFLNEEGVHFDRLYIKSNRVPQSTNNKQCSVTGFFCAGNRTRTYTPCGTRS
jgi:hypothetical protein